MTRAADSVPRGGRCTSGQTAPPTAGLILTEVRRSTSTPRLREVEAERDRSRPTLRLILSDGTHDYTVTARRPGMAGPVSRAPTTGQLEVPDTHVTADIDRCRDPRLLACADALHGEWEAHRPGARQYAERLLARNPGCGLVVLRSDSGGNWLTSDRACSRRLAFSYPRTAAALAERAPLLVACLQSWLVHGHRLRDLAAVTETRPNPNPNPSG